MYTTGASVPRPTFGAGGGVGIRILWIVLSLAVVAAAMGMFIGTQQKSQERYSRKAMEISEYGLMCALEALDKKPSWTAGFSKIPYQDGWYSAKLARRLKGDSVFCAIEAVGHMGGVSRKSECTLQLSIINGDSSWTRSGRQ
jgi:hypothetical protein